MLKRDKLEAMLRKITDDEFSAIWKNTYGVLPVGSRSELAKDFVAEQYDGELDGCIALAESLLTHALSPRASGSLLARLPMTPSARPIRAAIFKTR
jgi:hypothetical protein